MSNSFNICVIDDSEIISEMVARFLQERIPCNVEIFYSGEDFFSAHKKYDLVILDYLLNSKDKRAIDGSGVLKKIHDENQDTPVLIVTGITNPKLLTDIKNLGAAGLIGKDAPDFWSLLEREVKNTLPVI
jgi:DNA-binding NarL/FixJ family response regulator